MAKMRKKADLPTKLCQTCGKPFAWRKKWERDWDRVIYCSKRCQSRREPVKSAASQNMASQGGRRAKPA